MIARSRAIDEAAAGPRTSSTPGSAAQQGEAGEALDAVLERWRVAGLLARLPHEEAMLLRMRFYETGPGADRDRHPHLVYPLGTVKGRMVTGLTRLRELILEEER